MDMKEILEFMQADLDRARGDMASLKELIDIGVELKMNVSDRRAKVRSLEDKIKRYETVIAKHIKAHSK
ncbi:unnamed protein product [marine sediment metagenome]|uniref:Uncharacterized protein n=1 Tax=marine sediment metagenome TaxID=412755 RepID=X0YYL2_9ZZZZ